MFNEVLKSGVSNILSLSEIEWKLEQTSLPQVGTAAWRCRKSPCAPRGDRLAVQGTKGCLGSLVRLRMLGYFCFFSSSGRTDLQRHSVVQGIST